MGKNKLIDFIGITKEYDGVKALDNINLFVDKREFMTLLGPSGCGKTTLLRILAGFEQPTSGELFFEGADILGIPPYKRKVNTVFQKYALFPHLNVFDNIAFGLKIRKAARAEIEKDVHSMLELVGLKGFEMRDAESLSGGQQQRVAIARALVNKPEVLLLDEPLGALDLKMRQDMQLELKKMQQHLGITFIYVTHDQEEALTMSDTIAVMREGTIQQIGTPVDIYNEPKNAFVADFIGESNIIDGTMLEDLLVNFAGRDFVCVDRGFGQNNPVEVVVRPEDIKLVPAESGMLSGVVESIVFMGVHYEIFVRSNDFSWRVHTTASSQPGNRIGMDIYPDDIHIMRKGDNA